MLVVQGVPHFIGVQLCMWGRECLSSMDCIYACGAGNASSQYSAFILVVQGMPHKCVS